MLRMFVAIYVFCVFIWAQSRGAEIFEEYHNDDGVLQMAPAKEGSMEEAIASFERLASRADTREKRGEVLPVEEIEDLYEKMVEPLDNILGLVLQSSRVYEFLEARGIDRVILPYLHVYNSELRRRLLNLTKVLFTHAPTTTTNMIPIRILDKLLDIYEDSEDKSLKAKAIEILYFWLPENPKVQARVMKLKGLEPFYNEMHTSDADSVYMQLKLFSKILKEHIRARNKDLQSKTDLVNLGIYKKIGLLERLTSTNVCKGLFNIFHQFYNPKNKSFMVLVFELLIDAQPYCTKQMKGQEKAANIVKELDNHVKEMTKEDYRSYTEQGLNVTALHEVLERYVKSIDVHSEL